MRRTITALALLIGCGLVAGTIVACELIEETVRLSNVYGSYGLALERYAADQHRFAPSIEALEN